jgi:ketosteroid isomerase-like protein
MTLTWRKTLLCLLAVIGTVTPSEAQLSVPSDQDVLIQLERDWDAAFHRNDVRFIANVLADEFIATYPDGSRGDKAKELALAAQFNQQVDSSRVDEFTVKVYRDTAVVWFTQQMTGPSQGRQTTVTTRYVDVFVMRDGRWQCVASQSTKVAAP